MVIHQGSARAAKFPFTTDFSLMPQPTTRKARASVRCNFAPRHHALRSFVLGNVTMMIRSVSADVVRIRDAGHS
jgi:hypothetical protein